MNKKDTSKSKANSNSCGQILDLYPMLFCSVVVVYVAAAQTRGGECRDIEWCHLHAVLSVNISLTDEGLFFF